MKVPRQQRKQRTTLLTKHRVGRVRSFKARHLKNASNLEQGNKLKRQASDAGEKVKAAAEDTKKKVEAESDSVVDKVIEIVNGLKDSVLGKSIHRRRIDASI